MSIHISVESIQGKQRKDLIKGIQQRAQKEALLVIKEVLEGEGEEVLGRKKEGPDGSAANLVRSHGFVGSVVVKTPISFSGMDTTKEI